MKKQVSVIVFALMALAALEFGLLGVDAAGFTRGGSHTLPPVGQRGNVPIGTAVPTNTPALTPISLEIPASIELKAVPLVITCDGKQQSTVTVRLFDASGSPVPDGTFVAFSAYNGNASPNNGYTQNGYVSTSVVFYSDLFKSGPNVIVDSGPFEAGIRVRCVPISGCPLSPPASVSPPCGPTPTPYPCIPSPGSGPTSPPCPTPTPRPCNPSPGGPVSPPCPTPGPISPPAVSPPLGTLSLALDCTPAAPTSVGVCLVPRGATSFDVPVVVVNDSGVPVTLRAFNFNVHDSDTSRLLPSPGADDNLNGNPDFNQAAFPGSFQCNPPPPAPDLGTDGAGRAVSRLVCYSGAEVSGTPIPPGGGKLVIAVLHYSVPRQVSSGDVVLSFSDVAIVNGVFDEVGSCNPQIEVEMGCFGTTVHFGSFSPPAVPCGDVDGDGRVTVQDLLLVVSHTARKNYDARYDVNHDGRINAADAGIVRKQLGTRCLR